MSASPGSQIDASPSSRRRNRPRAMLGMTLLLVVTLLAVGPASAWSTPAAELQVVDAYILKQMRTQRIPGLALVVVEDRAVVSMQGYGRADESGRPMTPQTPVIIGSLSKAFTALAVMQLVEAGQVALDTPVQTYLPWFTLADPEASAQITVRHLLN